MLLLVLAWTFAITDRCRQQLPFVSGVKLPVVTQFSWQGIVKEVVLDLVLAWKLKLLLCARNLWCLPVVAFAPSDLSSAVKTAVM